MGRSRRGVSLPATNQLSVRLLLLAVGVLQVKNRILQQLKTHDEIRGVTLCRAESLLHFLLCQLRSEHARPRETRFLSSFLFQQDSVNGN